MQEYKDLLKTKKVLNALEELRKTLNKREFDIEFFSRDNIWFYIKKLDK